MSLLQKITAAQIGHAADEIDGKALTRPLLSYTDGESLTYVIDVDIGEKTPLKSVPIARGNRSLVYAEAGSALRLRRTSTGQFQVIGFSKEAPGTYTQIGVALDTLAIGAPQDISISARPLTYEELATLGGGYGVAPYGAIGVFVGGVLQSISA